MNLNDLEKEAADSAPKRNEIPPAGVCGSDLMKTPVTQIRQRIHIRLNEKCRSAIKITSQLFAHTAKSADAKIIINF